MPKLVNLQADERKELPKMGDKTVAFVQKCLEYGELHAELVPGYLDIADLRTDLQAITKLREFSRGLSPLIDALDDSLVLSGSEAYQAALQFYGNAKGAARMGVGAARQVSEDLAARFPGNQTRATAAKSTGRAG